MQIYRTPQGPAMLVRLDDRGKGVEYMFALVKNEMLHYRWETTLPDDFELVHDPGSRAEADIAMAEANALIREKEILLGCLEAALAMLPDQAAEQVRDQYRGQIKTADLVSRTRAA